MNRPLASFLVVALFVLTAACGGGAVPTLPGGQQTQVPGGAPAAPVPDGGDNQSKARALVPPGSTEMSAQTAGNAYTMVVSTSQTLDQLKSFYSTAIPGAGMTETGRVELGGTLTIAMGNPDGGVVAVPDASQGTYILTISVGTSSSVRTAVLNGYQLPVLAE